MKSKHFENHCQNSNWNLKRQGKRVAQGPSFSTTLYPPPVNWPHTVNMYIVFL